MTTTVDDHAVGTLGSVPGPTTPTREDLLERARTLGELARGHTEKIESSRRLPDALVDELVSSGLLRTVRHHRWGGLEKDVSTLLDVGRELARSCASLGWIYTVNSTHEWYLAFAHEQLQRDIWGDDPEAIVCDSLATMGAAEKVDGGWVLDGHWKFASGIEWASWIGVGAVVQLPDADEPEPVLMFVPKSDLTVSDQWHTLGLRGTASNDVVIERAFVPDHRLFPFLRFATGGAAALGSTLGEEGPLWRVPFGMMLGFAIFPTSLGVGQRAIDEFAAWTTKRVRPYDRGAEQREAPAAQLALAEASTQWDAAWALSERYAAETWRHAEAGTMPSDVERARYAAWRAFSARTCVELTDRLYTDSGAMALFDSHPLQQVFRDMHAAGAHYAVGRGDAYTALGRALLGFPSRTFF